MLLHTAPRLATVISAIAFLGPIGAVPASAHPHHRPRPVAASTTVAQRASAGTGSVSAADVTGTL